MMCRALVNNAKTKKRRDAIRCKRFRLFADSFCTHSKSAETAWCIRSYKRQEYYNIIIIIIDIPARDVRSVYITYTTCIIVKCILLYYNITPRAALNEYKYIALNIHLLYDTEECSRCYNTGGGGGRNLLFIFLFRSGRARARFVTHCCYTRALACTTLHPNPHPNVCVTLE